MPIRVSNESKLRTQMKARGWTEATIREALQTEGIRAKGKLGAAMRHVHPLTRQSLLVDNATGEIFHLGKQGYRYD